MSRLCFAFVLLCVLVGTAQAFLVAEDYGVIAGETNEAVITLEPFVTPRVSTMQDCGLEASFIFVSHDTATAQVAVEDGALCGTDVSFSLLSLVLDVQDIRVSLGTTAEGLDDNEANLYPPVSATIGPGNVVVFSDLPVFFDATVVISDVSAALAARFVADFTGNFDVDDVSGGFVLGELTGTVIGLVDPDGPGGPLGPKTVEVDLTLNLESASLAPDFHIFDNGFELGTTGAWDDEVPGT